LHDFALDLQELQSSLSMNMTKRGWCYVLEHHGLSKGEFKNAEDWIDLARLHGFLKPRFVLEEEGHAVHLFKDNNESIEDFVHKYHRWWKEAKNTFEDCADDYGVDEVSFWDDQVYYIQILVEKADLKSLFLPICKKYRISIANLRGWGSAEQKAELAAHFQEMESTGHIPVLLTCGDHDPAGLGISESLRRWFTEYSNFTEWNPENLIVERIGLNYDFIIENNLSWIDNLETGGKDDDGNPRDLSDPNHTCNKRNTYDIKGYIEKYGVRKCEANSVVVVPDLGRKLLQDAIDRYLGTDTYEKYLDKINNRQEEIQKLIEEKLEEEV